MVKGKFDKTSKVSKYYENDCRYKLIFTKKELLRISFMNFGIGIAIFKKQLTKPSFDLSSNLRKPSEKSLNFKKAAGLQSPVFSIRPRLSVKAVE